MAEVYHIKHNPINHIKHELKEHRDSNTELVRILIDNNRQMQENMSKVLKGLNELVSALKSAGEEPVEDNFSEAETPTTAGGDKLTSIERQIRELMEQNKQIMDQLRRMRPGAI